MRMRTLVFLLVFSLAFPLTAGPAETSAPREQMMEKLMAQAIAQAGKGPVARVTFDGAAAIEVLSFSWGVSNSGTFGSGGGAGSGKATFHDFSFVKRVDGASSGLYQACANGKHFKDVVIAILTDKGATMARLSFSDVMVSSYQTGGSEGEIPFEGISFNYNTLRPPTYEILIGL